MNFPNSAKGLKSQRRANPVVYNRKCVETRREMSCTGQWHSPDHEPVNWAAKAEVAR